MDLISQAHAALLEGGGFGNASFWVAFQAGLVGESAERSERAALCWSTGQTPPVQTGNGTAWARAFQKLPCGLLLRWVSLLQKVTVRRALLRRCSEIQHAAGKGLGRVQVIPATPDQKP